MLAAMTHPSRVLNLDMKAKALYAKELYLTAYISMLKVHKTSPTKLIERYPKTTLKLLQLLIKTINYD